MASRDKIDVDMFQKNIQYALEKLGKSKSGFERTVVSKFKRKRRVGSGNELVDYSRAPCLGADQKARGLWERDWNGALACEAHQRSTMCTDTIILGDPGAVSGDGEKTNCPWVSEDGI